MANLTIFAKIEINGAHEEYEGTYGTMTEWIEANDLKGCHPIESTAINLMRPWNAASDVNSVPEGMDVPISMEWTKIAPTLAKAMIEGSIVNITMTTITQALGTEQYAKGTIYEMTDGHVTTWMTVPGVQGVSTSFNWTYAYKKVVATDQNNTTFTLEQGSSGRS